MISFLTANESMINFWGFVFLVFAVFTHNKLFTGKLNTSIAFIGAISWSILLLNVLINGFEKGF